MKSIGIQLRISDLLYAVQKRWKIILSLTFVGIVFGVLLSGMTYVQSTFQTYQISGSAMIVATDSSDRYLNNSISPTSNDIKLAVDIVDMVYYFLRSDRMLEQLINDEKLIGITASDIRNALSISQYNDTAIVTIRLTWENGDEGLMLWNSLIDTANQLLPQLLKIGKLRVINEPVATAVGVTSSNTKTWMLLPVLGFAAGVGFAVIELLMHPTLTNVKDIETLFGLETIGIIPQDDKFFKNQTSMLVRDESSSSNVLQSYSAAAYILRNRLGVKQKCHCFYVTSAVSREGRTTVAANIAIQLSDMEHHTLLIDFDYKNPTIGSLFLNQVDYNRSLNALYRGEVTERDAITMMTGYLDILPTVLDHNPFSIDSTIIEMIDRLKDKYEYIIIDAPPVGQESETLSLNQIASTVLYVARYDVATIPEIQASLEKLDKSGIRVLGCVVNGVMSSLNRFFGGSKSKEQEQERRRQTRKQKDKILRKEKEFNAREGGNETTESLQALTSKGEKRSAGKEEKKGLLGGLGLGFGKAKPSEQKAKPGQKKPKSGKSGSAKAPGKGKSTAEPPEEAGKAAAIGREDAALQSAAMIPEESAQIAALTQEAAASSAQPQTGFFQAQPPLQEPAPVEAEEQADVFQPAPQFQEAAAPVEAEPQADMFQPAELPEEAARPPREEPVPPPVQEPIPADGTVLEGPPSDKKKPSGKKKPSDKKKPPDDKKPPKKPPEDKKKKPEKPETPEKTEKRGLFGRIAAKVATPKSEPRFQPDRGIRPGKTKENPFESAMSSSVVVNKSRNLFEDLVDEDQFANFPSDQDATDALVKMGLDGSWTTPADSSSNVSGPSRSREDGGGSRRRNVFDDL